MLSRYNADVSINDLNQCTVNLKSNHCTFCVTSTDVDPTKRLTLLSMLIGYTNYYTATFGVNQPSVQRLCALPSMCKSRWLVQLKMYNRASWLLNTGKKRNAKAYQRFLNLSLPTFCFLFHPRCAVLNGPLCAFITFLSCLSGIIAFAYYAQKGCDPIRGEIVSNQNQVGLA